MNLIHFLPWGSNPFGFPEDYPKSVRENQSGEVPAGWRQISRDEFDAYLLARKAQADAARANEAAAKAVEPPSPTSRWRVSKDTIITRLSANPGDLANVMAALATQSEEQRFIFNQLAWFWSDNPTLRGLCADLGIDADALLAPDPFLS